jgi:hypothetical protein
MNSHEDDMLLGSHVSEVASQTASFAATPLWRHVTSTKIRITREYIRRRIIDQLCSCSHSVHRHRYNKCIFILRLASGSAGGNLCCHLLLMYSSRMRVYSSTYITSPPNSCSPAKMSRSELSSLFITPTTAP